MDVAEKLMFPLCPDVLIPHEAPMVLIDKVLSRTAEATCCSVVVGKGLSPQVSVGSVPAWVAIEYIAQTVAVEAGITGDPSKSRKKGFLMGCRRVSFGDRHFEVGQTVHVEASLIYDEGPMAQFSGRVFDPHTNYQYAEATLSVYRPEQ